MGKLTPEEFKAAAWEEWRLVFSHVREFLDWIRENDYWEIGKVKKRKPIEKRYWAYMLIGRGADDKYYPDPREPKKSLSILRAVGWCNREVPKELQTDKYDAAGKIFHAQMNFKLQEPKDLLWGIWMISYCALASMFGWSDKHSAYVDVGPTDRFNELMRKYKDQLDQAHSFDAVEPFVKLVEETLQQGPAPRPLEDALTPDAFRQAARRIWNDRFPLVVQFLTWTKEQGHWEFGKVGSVGSVKDRYVENMLNGKGPKVQSEYGPVQLDADGKPISIAEAIRWCKRQVPQQIFNQIYGLTNSLIDDQVRWQNTEPTQLILGLSWISLSAFSSILGIAEQEYFKSKNPTVTEFRDAAHNLGNTLKQLKKQKKPVSFDLVAPLIPLVQKQLSQPQ